MRATWVTAAATMSILGTACPRASDTMKPAPDPSTKPLPPSPSNPPPPPSTPDVTRIVGDLEGTLSLKSKRVIVGEPIVATVDVRPTKAALNVFIGGDQRNEATYPTRVSFVARDAKGDVVCDTVDKPEVPCFGGLGSDHTFKVSETFRETAVLNAMCPAFATPGDYHLVLHRRLAPGGLVVTMPGGGTPTSCDIYPVHEGPLPKGYDPRCAVMMDALPSITSEVALHVDPFDAAVLRATTEARLNEASAAPTVDTMAVARISVWICDWVSCACPTIPGGTRTTKDVVDSLPAMLPKTFPRSCRTAKP